MAAQDNMKSANGTEIALHYFERLFSGRQDVFCNVLSSQISIDFPCEAAL
jgi:hypothetical protein